MEMDNSHLQRQSRQSWVEENKFDPQIELQGRIFNWQYALNDQRLLPLCLQYDWAAFSLKKFNQVDELKDYIIGMALTYTSFIDIDFSLLRKQSDM